MRSDIRIESIKTLLEAVQFSEEQNQECSELWWRGEDLICLPGETKPWDLKPKVYRKSYNESKLALRFLNRARVRHGNCPKSEDWPGWLFLMQHFGLPTRCLDWAESPLVALYFSVRSLEYHKASGRLWCLNTKKLNYNFEVNGVVVPQDGEAHFLCQEAFFPTQSKNEKILAVLADHSDFRHFVQSAAFTIHGKDVPLNGKYPERRNEVLDLSTCLIEYEVPGDAKTKLSQNLTSLGISESYLFPDLNSLSRDLERMDLIGSE